MENISSPSLEDSPIIDELAADLKKEKAPFEDFAIEFEKEELAKVHAAARWSRKYDPDQYAKAEKLGMGSEPERGIRQMELLENSAAILEYGKVFNKAPALRGYFAERPKELPKANPDELDNISGLEWITSAVPEAYKNAKVSIEASAAANRIARGQGTIYDRALVENFDQSRTYGADGWFDQGLIGATQSIPQLWETLKGSMRGSVLGGGTGAVVGSAVPGLGTAAGAVTGAGYGAIVGGYQQAWEINTGLNLLEFNKLRSEDGKAIDPEVAYTAARISGALGAMLDAVGVGPVIKAIPGAQRVISGLAKEGMKESLKQAGFREALYSFAKNTGDQIATETITEVLQQGVQIAAAEIAKANSEGEWQFKSADEMATELVQAGTQALQVMTLLAPFVSSTRFGADLVQINRSKREQDNLERVVTSLGENKLIERDPNLAADLIDRQLEDKKLYIPSEELVQLFQEQGIDRYGPPLPNWRQRLDTALAVGGDVEITVGEFVAHLGKDAKDNPLLDLVRTDPQAYTRAEIKQYSEALDELLLSEVELAQKRAALPTQRIETKVDQIIPELEELKKQIAAIGFEKKAVESYSTMFNAFFQTLSTRTGKSPSQLFQEFGVEVQRGLQYDGEQTPNTFNQSAPDTTDFKNWFKESKLVDETNNPKLVYHGTQGDFDAFSTGITWVTPDKEFAREYSELGAYNDRPSGTPKVLEGFASLQNPLNLRNVPDVLTFRKFIGEAINQAGSISPETAQKVNQLTEEMASKYPQEREIFNFWYGAWIEKTKEILQLLGFDGLDWPEDGSETYAIFSPSQFKAVNNEGTFDSANPNMYKQGGDIARGAITLDPNQPALIQLFEGHDMSTLLHEAGHFFLDTYSKIAPSSPELQADWELIKAKLKIEGDTITRAQHEEFARMTEAYFMKGKAPDPKLRPMFEQFRRWLKQIYQSIRKLGGNVDPEIAKVFDRMFVADERLEAIATDNAYAPIFDAAETMGLDPEEYLRYANLVDELKKEAQDSSRERIVGQADRLAKGWRGEIQKQLRSEAEEKLRATAPYIHFEELKQGKIKIDREALTKKYSAEAVKKFPAKSLAKEGLDPDLVAELLNYPTADEMVYDFTQALPLKEAAKLAAEQEMTKRYGENFASSEVMDLAIKEQMAQDGRLTVLGTELKALSRKAGKEISDWGPRQVAKEIARQSVYARQVKDLNSSRAQNAVHRAASMAQSAIVKGDWAKAADWKRKQLIAQAVANEIELVNKAVSKIRDKAARYTRTASGSVHPSYMEQIRALVENYDFAKISGKKLSKRISLREFIDQITAEGDVVLPVPDRLLRDAGRVNYKELTAEDLLGLGDTIDNLEHLGRVKQKLRRAKELREFEQVKGEILESLKLRPTIKKEMKTYTEEERTMMDRVIDFHATLLKPEQIIEFLDSGNIKGPMMEHIFQPITDALNLQNELATEYNRKIMEIFDKIPANYLLETVSIPGFDQKMTREEIYAAALNTGNPSSRKKLLEGELWSEEQLGNVLANMDKEDWDRVQSVWNVLESLWPKIAQLEKRLTGVAPPKVENRVFNTPFGEYQGGYYPVVYDFKTRRGRALIEDVTPVDKRFANGLFSNDFVRPGTNHKYTTKRTKTAKPIKLSLGILPAHIQTVIHDLTHREAIRDAYKVLWDPEIQRAIEDVEGNDVYRQLQNWLKSVATERHLDDDPVARRIQHLRTGMTIFGLGYRFSTVAAQALGLFPSLTKVNKGFLMNAVYQSAKHPQKTWDFVTAASTEMKHRMNQQDRDIRAAVQDITSKKNVVDWFKLHAFTFIGWMDRAVSTVTWLGAYSEYISKHPGERDIAVRHADRTVRLTQGTGNVKDMAQIMNSKNELNRLFTMFYSGFSAQYNLQVDLYRKTKRDISEGDWRTVALERLPQWMYLTVFPAILGAWITGDAPEEDETTAAWMARKALLYPMASVPFIRDVAGAMDTGFDYKMSPVSRVGESSVKGLRELLDLTDEDKEFELRRFAKPAGEVASIILHLPTGQAISTVDNLWKGLEEGDLKARDLIYRRRD